ncbi:MAG: hypothetical protein M5U14_14085 [Acidimicrobiia bacterium]|nr:hypothetical protein [Acidimicrobiia bacterium]
MTRGSKRRRLRLGGDGAEATNVKGIGASRFGSHPRRWLGAPADADHPPPDAAGVPRRR